MELKELKETTKELLFLLDQYEEKPTKATSKKIRLALGEIKRETPSLRKKLLELDRNQ
jgi:hypothetical protein